MKTLYKITASLGILMSIAVLVLLPHYIFPEHREFLRGSIKQMIIFFGGIIICAASFLMGDEE